MLAHPGLVDGFHAFGPVRPVQCYLPRPCPPPSWPGSLTEEPKRMRHPTHPSAAVTQDQTLEAQSLLSDGVGAWGLSVLACWFQASYVRTLDPKKAIFPKVVKLPVLVYMICCSRILWLVSRGVVIIFTSSAFARYSTGTTGP